MLLMGLSYVDYEWQFIDPIYKDNLSRFTQRCT